MNRTSPVLGFSLTLVIASSVSLLACTSDSVEEAEENVGTAADGLTRLPDGNTVVTPADLADPGTGCFVLNPVCAIRNDNAQPVFTREVYTMSAHACAGRAEAWATFCGNRRGDITTTQFRVHGRVIGGASYTPPNDSRCVVNLPICRRFPHAAWGRFAEEGGGADVNPARCAARAQEYFSWCANLPSDRVITSFEVGGAVLATTVFPR